MPSVRKYAIKTLEKVISDRAQPKDAVDEVAADLDRRDRAFLMELVGGTLRNYLRLKWISERFIDKPGGLPASTKLNIMVALHQILNMRVPDFAAVNEAVELEDRFRGLVNAVLRNALRQQERLETEFAGMERSIIKGRMKGQELAAQLLESCPNVNVLFMSGYLCPSMAHKGRGQGSEAFIRKPFTINALLRKMRTILS